jgi:hypothetical protein
MDVPTVAALWGPDLKAAVEWLGADLREEAQ